MEFILGFAFAVCLMGVFFLGAFYGIYITEKNKRADYEIRLKADMVAMLEELEVELYEKQYNYNNRWVVNHRDISELINEKINALKGEKNE